MDGDFCWYKHQKSQTESSFSLFMVVIDFRKLKNLISPIHHKERDGHDDVNSQKSKDSRNPRLEKFKTVTKQGRTKSC